MPTTLSLELALVLLLAAIIAVPLFRKLGLVAVLAYLATGVLLGPDGIGVVRDPDRILAASEIGVVRPERAYSLRRWWASWSPGLAQRLMVRRILLLVMTCSRPTGPVGPRRA